MNQRSVSLADIEPPPGWMKPVAIALVAGIAALSLIGVGMAITYTERAAAYADREQAEKDREYARDLKEECFPVSDAYRLLTVAEQAGAQLENREEIERWLLALHPHDARRPTFVAELD